jgi:anti-anti-sigma factor
MKATARSRRAGSPDNSAIKLARFPQRPQVLSATLEGELTHHLAYELRAGLARLASFRPRELVVDLSKVTFIDPSIISMLVSLEHRIEAAGGSLVVRAQGPVERTLTAMGRRHLIASATPEPRRDERSHSRVERPYRVREAGGSSGLEPASR